MMEVKDKGLLEAPPRDPKEKIANRLFFERVGLVSVAMAATAFIIYWSFGHIALASSNIDIMLTQAQTAALMSVVMVHIGYVMTARSTFGSAFTFSPFSNKWLLWGIALTIIIDLMMVYLPFMNTIFRTAPFPAHWWLWVLIGLPVGFGLPELEKLVRRRLSKGDRRFETE